MTSPTPRRNIFWWRLLFAGLFFAALMTLPLPLPIGSRFAVAWTLAMAALLGWFLWNIFGAERSEMIRVAPTHVSHGWIPDLVAGLLSIAGVVMLALLSNSDINGSLPLQTAHTFVSLVGVLFTWMVMNGTFALRYAAIYYAPTSGGSPRGGLRF